MVFYTKNSFYLCKGSLFFFKVERKNFQKVNAFLLFGRFLFYSLDWGCLFVMFA